MHRKATHCELVDLLLSNHFIHFETMNWKMSASWVLLLLLIQVHFHSNTFALLLKSTLNTRLLLITEYSYIAQLILLLNIYEYATAGPEIPGVSGLSGP